MRTLRFPLELFKLSALSVNDWRFVLVALVFCFGGLVAHSAWAAPARPVETNTIVEARLASLGDELRCLKCQNQSLNDSPADLAEDLRGEIRAMVVDGKADAEIKQFLVDRYGDFVLYQPKMAISTYLLWFAPFLLAVTAVWLLFRIFRNRE